MRRGIERASTQTWAERLAAAGWSGGRRHEVQSIIDAYERAGFRVWPELIDFLASFNGLTIRSADPDNLNAAVLDAPMALRLSDVEETQDCERLAGTVLAPVGFYAAMLIYFGRNRSFYGQHGHDFGPLGDSLEEAVTSTIDRGEYRPLGMRLSD